MNNVNVNGNVKHIKHTSACLKLHVPLLSFAFGIKKWSLKRHPEIYSALFMLVDAVFISLGSYKD